jgi:hypothetical protein
MKSAPTARRRVVNRQSSSTKIYTKILFDLKKREETLDSDYIEAFSYETGTGNNSLHNQGLN